MTATSIKIYKDDFYDIFINEKDSKEGGQAGSIAVPFAKQIAAKKNHSIFEEMNDTDRESLAVNALEEVGGNKPYEMKSCGYSNRNGKPIYLSRFQTKVIAALSYHISQNTEAPDLKEYISYVQEGKQPPHAIERAISITELTKFLSTEGKARARDKERVIKALKELDATKQVFEIKSGEDRHIYISSLINITDQLIDLSPDKAKNMDAMNIRFGKIFFADLCQKYAILPRRVFKIWGQRGSGTETELFDMMLLQLSSLFWYHKRQAKAIEAKIRKEAEGEGISEEQLLTKIRKAQRTCLTYREKLSTLKERVTTDYDVSRSKKKKFLTDIDNAIKALEKIGLLEEGQTKIIESTDKKRGTELVADFVFNIDYK